MEAARGRHCCHSLVLVRKQKSSHSFYRHRYIPNHGSFPLISVNLYDSTNRGRMFEERNRRVESVCHKYGLARTEVTEDGFKGKYNLTVLKRFTHIPRLAFWSCKNFSRLEKKSWHSNLFAVQLWRFFRFYIWNGEHNMGYCIQSKTGTTTWILNWMKISHLPEVKINCLKNRKRINVTSKELLCA